MLDFIKSAPWSFAVAGLILVGAIAGVIYGVIRKGNWADKGLMTTPEGFKLRWRRLDLPLPVWFATDLSKAWIEAWNRASSTISEAAGRNMFMPALAAFSTMDTDQPQRHAVIIRDDQGVDPNHGATELQWDTRDGVLHSAHVTFPEALEGDSRAYAVALHEAMHVLGFDHDEHQSSIMYPALTKRPQTLTDHDRKLLREIYG